MDGSVIWIRTVRGIINGWIRDLDSNGEASGTIGRNLEVDQEDPT